MSRWKLAILTLVWGLLITTSMVYPDGEPWMWFGLLVAAIGIVALAIIDREL